MTENEGERNATKVPRTETLLFVVAVLTSMPNLQLPQFVPVDITMLDLLICWKKEEEKNLWCTIYINHKSQSVHVLHLNQTEAEGKFMFITM